jgi:hypothetical protein
VDNRAEVREFLVSRRAKLTPEQAGLPSYGRRRVPGLRRSEVAALAWESLDLRAEPGLTMTIYAAEPGSPTEHALALLASWAATSDAPSAASKWRSQRRSRRASHTM